MPSVPFIRRVHGWLVLARCSNLPTVWSSSLAGWWLGGDRTGDAGEWHALALLLAGVSALFAGGMFLDGVFDVEADGRHEIARPIFTGLVGRRTAGLAGTGLLLGGVGLLAVFGGKPLLLAALLASLTVSCAWLYNRTVGGRALMAGSRWLLYPVAASASASSGAMAWSEGGLLATYVFGLGCFAHGERAPCRTPARWPWALILFPLVCNAMLAARLEGGRWIFVAPLALWLGRVVFGKTGPLGGSRADALLAGTVLVDLSAVAACATVLPWTGWFAILFALAVLFQRFVPDT